MEDVLCGLFVMVLKDFWNIVGCVELSNIIFLERFF